MSIDNPITSDITGDSKAIVTNQPGIHEKLEALVKKHLANPSKKPYQAHTEQAFAEINTVVNDYVNHVANKTEQPEVILDSCCGVGQSTRLLAKRNPHALVIGVDKSAHRINRNVDEITHDDGSEISNYRLIRADLNDFYRLVVNANWPIKKHYILYPNPWPKSKHIQRRWHGSAVFPEIMRIGEQIILRSNWLLYLEEFQFSAEIANRQGQLSVVEHSSEALTPFEAKFHASGQQCWQLVISN